MISGCKLVNEPLILTHSDHVAKIY